MPVRQGDIFRFLKKKIKGLHLTPFSQGEGVWPLLCSSFLLLSLLPFISFARFSPRVCRGRGGGWELMTMPIKERSSSTGRKYL